MNDQHTDTLIVSVLPLDMAYTDKDANLRAATAMFANLQPGTHIAVLPELFSTAYIPDREAARAIAETNDGKTIAFVRDMASKHNCAICGSFLALDNDRVYNRAFFITPAGESHFYDKRHLFSLSGEGEVVSGGEMPPAIIDFCGWKIAIAVCYDLRFPIWLRNTGLKYDALIIPANWPEKRSFAWTTLLQARAIENQAYVVGANRSGSDQFGVYDNQSFVADYTGHLIQQPCGNSVTANLSKFMLDKYRKAFPFWKDAD